MKSQKLTFSQFSLAVDGDIESLTEEQLNEIFGQFFSKLSGEAKKKKEEELKKKIAATQAKIAANKQRQDDLLKASKKDTAGARKAGDNEWRADALKYRNQVSGASLAARALDDERKFARGE